MGRRKKEFAGEPSGKKRKGQSAQITARGSKGAGAFSVNDLAEIKVDGRDFVFRGCSKLRRVAELEGELKSIGKLLKVTKAKLQEEVTKGVVEGGSRGQTAMLFPSLEAAELQAQTATLDHIEIGLGMCNRLQDVPLASLEKVRKAMNAAVDSGVTVKSEDELDGKSAASGEGRAEAAG
jgi:hypothetical protein